MDEDSGMDGMDGTDGADDAGSDGASADDGSSYGSDDGSSSEPSYEDSGTDDSGAEVSGDDTATVDDGVDTSGPSDLSGLSDLPDSSVLSGPDTAATPRLAVVAPTEGILADPSALTGDVSVPAGLDPQMWVDPSTVTVDPMADSIAGAPEIGQGYFQYQGTGNANCGPYSAAMAINELTGANISGEEIAEFAKSQGWMTQDFVNGNKDWNYWSGLTPEQLEATMDHYLAASGGDASDSQGTIEDLAGHLDAGHPVVAMVDSSEILGSNVSDDPNDRTPNHFVTVTGIDRVHDQVFLNDPAQTAPVVMPLTQFEAAWRDSGNRMLDVHPGAVPSADPTSGLFPEPGTPLVPLPTAPSVPVAPTPYADATLSAVPTSAPVPDAPVLAQGCCLLPMTITVLAVDPVATVGAPPVPPAVAALGVPPNTIPTTSGLSSSVVPPMGRTGL